LKREAERIGERIEQGGELAAFHSITSSAVPAEAVAIKQFALDDDQRRRLLIRERL